MTLKQLFERAKLVKQRLQEEESSERFREWLSRAKDVWKSYKPSKVEKKVAAIDSGWNYRTYCGFYLYAIRAVAVAQSSETVTDPIVDVDILPMEDDGSGISPELYIQGIAECYEHDLASKVANLLDIVLVDGSILARLNAMRTLSRVKLFREYAVYVRPLKNAKNILFVSKYSQDRSLVHGALGDVYYINRVTNNIGYTEPITFERDGMTISVFYVRLSKNSDAIHVEVPAIVDLEYVRSVIDALYNTAVKGYPYALMVAHEIASLPNDFMDMISEVAGLSVLPTAREVLEVG
ncbi:MAG: DNA double-strand break repair nuclease NurA [Nitrososphaerota archaeon]